MYRKATEMCEKVCFALSELTCASQPVKPLHYVLTGTARVKLQCISGSLHLLQHCCDSCHSLLCYGHEQKLIAGFLQAGEYWDEIQQQLRVCDALHLACLPCMPAMRHNCQHCMPAVTASSSPERCKRQVIPSTLQETVCNKTIYILSYTLRIPFDTYIVKVSAVDCGTRYVMDHAW
jgi:hypothetical protein